MKDKPQTVQISCNIYVFIKHTCIIQLNNSTQLNINTEESSRSLYKSPVFENTVNFILK